jgi:hypothetical protein
MVLDQLGMRIIVLERLVERGVMRGGHEDVAHRDLRGFALMGFVIPGLLVVFVGFEDLVQPRQQLIDRRQRSGRALLAARSGGTLWSGRTWLSLRSRFAACALRTRLALCTRFALCTRLAVRAGLAAKTVRSAPPWLSLRAAWPRSSLADLLADRIFCHDSNSTNA